MSFAERCLELARLSLEAKTAYRLTNDEKQQRATEDGCEFILHRLLGDHYKGHKPVKERNPKEPLLPPYKQYREVEHFTESPAAHYIFINKFMYCPGHVVISADSPEKHQRDRLELGDFHALAHVMNAFDGKGIGYYNCGPASGCSQIHKHLQFAPMTDNPLLPKLLANTLMPFKYFSMKLASLDAPTMQAAYDSLMPNIETPDYNVIVAQNTLILVPRRCQGNSTGIVINSLGFCGHFLTWDYNVDAIAAHPLQILTEVGVPA